MQFVPLIDTDGFNIYLIEQDENFSVGQSVPIPSRTAMFGVVTQDASFYIEAFDQLSEEHDPLFQLELSAIVGLEIKDAVAALADVEKTFFSDRDVGAKWLDIELRSRGASEVYWTSLDQDPAKELLEELEALGLEDTHDALQWLQRNFRSGSWIKVWLYARMLLPLSKELRDISASWLNVMYSEFTVEGALESPEFVAVLLFVCELSTTRSEFDELYDVVEELHLERPDILQFLVNSKVSHRNLVQTFNDHGNFAAADSADYWARLKGYSKA